MQRIRPEDWNRKPLSDFFGAVDIPFFNVAFRRDVTRLYERAKGEGGSVFFYAVHGAMRALNSVDAFLYKLRGEEIVRHDYLSPSFTAPAEGELVKIVTLDWDPAETAAAFSKRAAGAAAAQRELFPPAASEARDDLAYLTCLPWLDFTCLTNEMPLKKDDSVPRLGWGKITWQNGWATMPCSVEVNHRLIDGRHVGQLCEALQAAWDGTL